MEGPYLLLPRGSTPLQDNAPLPPAFPLYDFTSINGNISLSSFNIGLTPTFSSTHLVMASPLVYLELDADDAAQALLVCVGGG